MKNKRYNDPKHHKPIFFRALDNAIKNGDLQKWKANQLRREYEKECEVGING